MVYMVHKLATLTTTEEIGPDGTKQRCINLNLLKDLSDAEHADYQKANDYLRQFERDRYLFLIVQANYRAFEGLLSTAFSVWSNELGHLDFDRVSIETNRALLNFLSSFKAYLEHTQYILVRRYGRGFGRHNSFKETVNKAVETSPAFGFMFELRNYAQHCGLPVSTIQLNTEQRDLGQIVHIMQVIIRKDDLLIGRDKKRQKMEKLLHALVEALPVAVDENNIDIRLPLFQTMEELVKIDKSEVQKDLPEALEALGCMNRLLEGLPMNEGLVLAEYDFEDLAREDRMKPLTLQGAPLSAMNLVRHLQEELAARGSL